MFINNCNGVSEVIGEVLMLSIVIILFSSVGSCLFSLEGPEEFPHAEMHGWMEMSSDTLYLKHKSGETLNVNELEIVLNVNDQRYPFSSENISSKLDGKNYWEIGDVITIEIGSECGVTIQQGDRVSLYLIHVPTSKVVQKMYVTAFESP